MLSGTTSTLEGNTGLFFRKGSGVRCKMMKNWGMIGGIAAALAAGIYVLWGPILDRKKHKKGLVPGLLNLGNTCFMNSLLQGLSACPSFIKWLEDFTSQYRTAQNTAGHQHLSVTLLHLLRALCNQESSGDDVLDASPLLEVLRMHRWQISSFEEQDAHELFHVLTSSLEDERDCQPHATHLFDIQSLEPPLEPEGQIHCRTQVPLHPFPKQWKSQHPFHGRLTSNMVCKRCQHQSPMRYDTFDSLSLSIPAAVWGRAMTLDNCLQHFVSTESVKDVVCENCTQIQSEERSNGQLVENQKTTFVKQLKLGKLPQCLCIHLQRLSWSNQGSPLKRNEHVQFGEFLVLDRFKYRLPNCANTKRLAHQQPVAVQGTTDGPTGSDGPHNPKMVFLNGACSPSLLSPPTNYLSSGQDYTSTSSSYLFRLMAVIVHHGDMHSGHFVTYRRSPTPKTQKPSSQQWLWISDDTVRKANLQEVLSSSAYLLFYERVRSKPLHPGVGLQAEENLLNTLPLEPPNGDSFSFPRRRVALTPGSPQTPLKETPVNCLPGWIVMQRSRRNPGPPQRYREEAVEERPRKKARTSKKREVLVQPRSLEGRERTPAAAEGEEARRKERQKDKQQGRRSQEQRQRAEEEQLSGESDNVPCVVRDVLGEGSADSGESTSSAGSDSDSTESESDSDTNANVQGNTNRKVVGLVRKCLKKLGDRAGKRKGSKKGVDVGKSVKLAGPGGTTLCALSNPYDHVPKKIRRRLVSGKFVDVFKLTRQAVNGRDGGSKGETGEDRPKHIMDWVPVQGEVAQSGKPRNLKSAQEYPQVVRDKLEKELRAGRMAGPFESPPLRNLIVSPLGVVPKREPGKFRLIQHLSYPEGRSVNDAIDEAQCSVQYQSFEQALQLVIDAGPGALMAKLDIESAFRLLPLHPSSFRYMGCWFQGRYYVDRCLPMGCSVSCAFFEVFSSFLHWEVELRPGSVAHYLDDFMFVGPRDSEECGESLELALARFKDLGVPVAGDKTVRPTTRLTFLAIEIDSMDKLVRLPLEKVQLARDQVRRALGASKLQLRVLQSLLGTLNFATRVIPMGRVFSRRLEQATVGVKQPFHWVRVTKQLKEDLKVWEAFLEDFNGVRLWRSAPESSAELQLETDASAVASTGRKAVILGHSFVYWAWRRAVRKDGRGQLGIPQERLKVNWLGKRGLKWGQVWDLWLAAVERWGRPHVVVIHSGGNDLAEVKTVDLICQIKDTCQRIMHSCPEITPVKKARQDHEDENTKPVSPPLSPEQLERIQKNKAAALLKLASRYIPEGVGESWRQELLGEFSKPYFIKLSNFVAEERKRHTVYPPPQEVFTWTQMSDIRDVKVVILGQDPYHGPNQAHGLCFSVKKPVPPPPSLENMYKELQTDIEGFKHPGHGDLTGWAKQGVLLLNAVLTVRAHNANSHKDHGWEQFTDSVVSWLNKNLDGLVFMLWGAYAQKKGISIDRKRHCVLQTVHPSPLSAHRGFFGCHHFSKTNTFLQNLGKEPIDWKAL
ncbi:ubiquitin carboxyl-terminal hydrolase 30 [Rhinophrynus dorsalis]